MPSLFHKRRGSDIPPELATDTSPSQASRVKWQPPADNSRLDKSSNASSPPGGKIRSFFRSSMSEETKEGMRRKLSSPSELFKRGPEPSRSDITSGWEEVNPLGGGTGAADRYADAAPRSANGYNGNYASPSVFPENFSLSQTASPESSPAARKRGSQQWTPSYPLVLPEGEDGYADLAPDGLPNGASNLAASPVAAGGENANRRSMEMRPKTLAQWEPLKPDAPKSISPAPSTPTRQTADLPKTTEQPGKPALLIQTGGVAFDKAVPQLDTQPLLSSEPASRRESEEPLVATPDMSGPSSPTEMSSSTTFPSRQTQTVPASPMSPMVAPIPGMIIGPNGKMRPAMPSRRTTLIQSPPMPQPIKNLPTMQGWPGFNQVAGAPSTPGWGGMGKESAGVPRTPIGMPRTPGWGGFGTPGSATPRTPGGGGFPFSMSAPSSATKDKGKSAATDDELRKMRRAMPVMLRQASTKPMPVDDGGGAGDDDDDDDDGSDTEVQGGDEDDSDVETETEPSPMKGKGKAKTLSPLDRLKGKGKGKASSGKSSTPAPSSLSISSVINEEEENPSIPRKSPGLLERRAKLSPPIVIPSPPPAAASSRPEPVKKASATNGEPNWSIGNDTGAQGGWMNFASSTPTWTPFNATPKAPQTPGAGAKKDLASDEGYFGNAAASPPVEDVPLPSVSISDPSLAPSLDVDLGEPISASHLSSPPVAPPIDSPMSDISSNGGTGEGNDGSDEGSDATSPPSTNTSLPQSPAVVDGRPTPSKRPSLYTQATRSLVDLRPRTSMEQDSTSDPVPAEDVDMEPTLAAMNDNHLAPITSGEPLRIKEMPARIEIPKRQSFMREAGGQTPGWLKAPPTPSTPGGAGQVFWARGKGAEGFESKSKAKRRRSAGDQELPPPDYEPPHPGVVIPRPRDDEGREVLPEYWCAVHIEGMLSRKMEFQAPGVQARDRSWKKYYCILRGTSLTLYKFDPRRFVPKEGAPPSVGPIGEAEEEEHLHVHIPADQLRRASVSSGTGPGLHGSAIAARRGSVGDAMATSGRRGSVSTASLMNPAGDRARAGSVSGGSGLPAGFDAGRRGSLTGTGSTSSINQSTDSSRRTSVSGTTGSGSTLSVNAPSSAASAEKDPALFAKTNRRPSVGASSTASSSTSSNTTSALAHFQTNHLVKTYTLQNAESGLAADYIKRKNVVRIRSEGEQFLLQTEGAREVVDWIEAFQAATNVALDLDDRPMPKIITLPRRRRRRPAAGAAGAAGAAAVGAVVGGADTPEANIRAVQEAERAQAQMDRDLAADQANPAAAVS